MRHFGLGLIFGIMLTILASWLFFSWLETDLTIATPQTSRTQAAGISQNYANLVPPAQQISVILGLTDSSASSPTPPITDYTSLEITFAKAEALLNVSNKNQWEVLNLTQPTVELFSLRGSGSVAELGTTKLAAGAYHTIRLTLLSIKARRPSGQIMDLPLTDTNRTFDINRNFVMPSTDQEIQLVIDLDSLRSLVKENGEDRFQPALQAVIQNDLKI